MQYALSLCCIPMQCSYGSASRGVRSLVFGVSTRRLEVGFLEGCGMASQSEGPEHELTPKATKTAALTKCATLRTPPQARPRREARKVLVRTQAGKRASKKWDAGYDSTRLARSMSVSECSQVESQGTWAVAKVRACRDGEAIESVTAPDCTITTHIAYTTGHMQVICTYRPVAAMAERA